MVTSHQQAASSVRRDAWVEVDLSAIEQNISVIKRWLVPDQAATSHGWPQPAQIMAVVKSDAYGHGAAKLAELFSASGIAWLATASVDEGCQLRDEQVDLPVLVLSPTPLRAIGTALEYGLDMTITSAAEIKTVAAAAAKLNKQARLHLKVDTGMHRLGCSPKSANALIEEIKSYGNLELISVFSHLAKANDYSYTLKQKQLFDSVLKRANYVSGAEQVVDKQTEPDEAIAKHRYAQPFLAHLASSEAARLFKFTHYDLVRVGLHIYGLQSRTHSGILTPALSLRGRINHLAEIEAGEAVGYGLTWTTNRPTRLATIPVGYADGVPRLLSNRISGICLGRRISQVGTISMDQMLFDVTDLPQAQGGDVVTLIGKDGDLSCNLADWAVLLDTITYELACQLRVRLPRVYTRQRHLNIV